MRVRTRTYMERHICACSRTKTHARARACTKKRVHRDARMRTHVPQSSRWHHLAIKFAQQISPSQRRSIEKDVRIPSLLPFSAVYGEDAPTFVVLENRFSWNETFLNKIPKCRNAEMPRSRSVSAQRASRRKQISKGFSMSLLGCSDTVECVKIADTVVFHSNGFACNEYLTTGYFTSVVF